MKHFIIGPVELYPSTKKVRESEFAYFRSDEFSRLTLKTLGRLSLLLGNHTPHALIYMAASGTAAMEATVENCVALDDKVLVIDGGSFGHRFCELLSYHRKRYEAVSLKWNEALSKRHLEPFEDQGFTMLFVNLHETQTGQLYDIEMLSDFCRRNRMMLVVDAISTFLADEYDMGKYHIDLTITSSQKGLALSPGMSFVSFSRRMLDKLDTMPAPESKYFDFKDYLANMQRGQTPYTPPVFVMYELADMLKVIEEEGGLQARLDFIARKAQYFRKRSAEMAFTIPSYPLSHALTPLYFADLDAMRLVQILKERYDTYVNPCGGELAHRMLRISHIGNTTMQDIDELLEHMKAAVLEIRETQR